MIPLSPILLTAAAQAFVGLGEDKRLVARFLHEVNAAGRSSPWDAAFVHHVGYWSHFNDIGSRSSWPLPATADVEELAQYCGSNGLFRIAPLPGDLFLQHNLDEARFERTGIITRVSRVTNVYHKQPFWRCLTIEGDSRHESLGAGARVLRRRRTFSPMLGDHFVRWTALENRDERQDVIEMAVDGVALAERAA